MRGFFGSLRRCSHHFRSRRVRSAPHRVRCRQCIATTSWKRSRRPGAGKIKHVVIIVQENRSFDNLFQGYPGADTVPRGKNSKGADHRAAAGELGDASTLSTTRSARCSRCDGTGNLPGTMPHGRLRQGRSTDGRPAQAPAVRLRAARRVEAVLRHGARVGARPTACSSRSSTRASSRTSTSSPRRRSRASICRPVRGAATADPSDYVATITAQRTYRQRSKRRASITRRSATNSTTPGSRGASTRASTHDVERIRSVWSGYQAVKHIRYGPDWKNDVITPQKRFLKDVAAGKLANVTWITPICDDSDHVNCGGGYGPSWVASLVNAVGKSKFWNSTAIFVHVGRLGRPLRSSSAAV